MRVCVCVFKNSAVIWEREGEKEKERACTHPLSTPLSFFLKKIERRAPEFDRISPAIMRVSARMRSSANTGKLVQAHSLAAAASPTTC